MNNRLPTDITNYFQERLEIIFKETASIKSLLKDFEVAHKQKGWASIKPLIDWDNEIIKVIKRKGGASTKAEIINALKAELKISHQQVKNEVSGTLLFNEQKRFVKVKEEGHYLYRLS
ncbi:MAG: hypothetical protein ABI675_15040 [Chitinophagaceae bacterium]